MSGMQPMSLLMRGSARSSPTRSGSDQQRAVQQQDLRFLTHQRAGDLDAALHAVEGSRALFAGSPSCRRFRGTSPHQLAARFSPSAQRFEGWAAEPPHGTSTCSAGQKARRFSSTVRRPLSRRMFLEGILTQPPRQVILYCFQFSGGDVLTVHSTFQASSAVYTPEIVVSSMRPSLGQVMMPVDFPSV